MGLTAGTRIHFGGLAGLILLLQVLDALPTDFTAPEGFRAEDQRIQRIHRGTELRDQQRTGFPAAWNGVWFQSGISDTISINSTTIDSKGDIVQHLKVKGLVDKYLLHDRINRCHRCMAISSPHSNVIQYKESFCVPEEEEPAPSLDGLCGKIAGDADLYFMFRVNAAAEKCPFSGRFAFTYAQNMRECTSPVSAAESCVKGTEMMLQYKSCPDLTEERKVRLECQASWSRGDGQWYLVGRTFHQMYAATSNEETYRCFVSGLPAEPVWSSCCCPTKPVIYEVTGKGEIKVSQSADASCTGLYSATGGELTMKMTQVDDPTPQCVFPTWLTHVRQWHDMASSAHYVFGSPETSMKQYSLNATSDKGLILDATCLRKDSPDGTAETSAFRAVAFVVRGCSSGYMCLNWRRRSDQVVQLQEGRLATSAILACSDDYWNNQTEWTTLVSSSPLAVQCPFPGQYLLPTPQSTSPSSKCGDMTKVTIGCHKSTTIQFVAHPDDAECSTELENSKPMHFTCHGHWMDNKIGYFVASETNKLTKHCFVYQEDDRGVLRLSSIPHRCPSSLYSGEQFNVTEFNDCDANISGSPQLLAFSIWLLVVSAILAIFCR